MRGWTNEGRDARRAAAKTASAARSKINDYVADTARTEAQRVNTMRLNAATLMLNRAMSDYAEEAARP